MPQATLKYPRSLTIYGKRFLQGTVTPVSPDLFRKLRKAQDEGDDRFRLKQDDPDEAVSTPAPRSQAVDRSERGDLTREDLLDTAVKATDQGNGSDDGEGAGGDTGPEDPLERIAAIALAIDQVDMNNEEAWTQGGKPTVFALAEILGWQPTAVERDQAMVSGQGSKAGSGGAPATGGIRIVKRTPETPGSDDDKKEEGTEV